MTTEGVHGTARLPGRWKGVAKDAAASALACLAAACILLAANARSPSRLDVVGVQVLSSASLCLGVLSLVAGLAYLARARPDVRRPLAFVVAVTLVVLCAHLYVINSPPTVTPGSPLSGTVGTTFSDSYLSVSSRLSGTELVVNVTDFGENAVSSLTLALGNLSLPASGFAQPPTVSDPLEPAGVAIYGFRYEAGGSWVVPAGSSETLAVSYQYLTCYHVPDLGDKRGVLGCIMDESYYVPAAQTLLAGTQCSTSVPNCNLEHPFLAKAIIAAGIAVFGLGDFGWRIFMVALGTLCVPLLFALAYVVSGNRRLACFATVLLALDTMFFVHSSAALIDIPVVFFSLIGFILYFWRSSYWRVDHLLASGAFFGLAALSKETAVFMLAAVVTFELASGENFKSKLVRSLKVLVPAALVFVAGVQAYDTLLASGSYPYFYQQLAYILHYGSGLKGGGWTDDVLHSYITPLNWITFYSPVSYLVDTATATVGGSAVSYVSVGYYGVANVVVVWMVFFWVPLAVYRALKSHREGAALAGDDRLALFFVVWFLWSYVPYVLLWLYGRVTYPFYMVPAIPALAGGAAYFATRAWFSRWLALVYVAAAFALFFLFFPVKDFLPVFVRVALGR